jgi:hypothetical protein
LLLRELAAIPTRFAAVSYETFAITAASAEGQTTTAASCGREQQIRADLDST